MIDKINETGYMLLKNGTIIESFQTTLENTFLGIWIWVILLFVIDGVILVKSRNAFLTSAINLILLMVFQSFFPTVIFLYLLVPSIMAIAGSIYSGWK